MCSTFIHVPLIGRHVAAVKGAVGIPFPPYPLESIEWFIEGQAFSLSFVQLLPHPLHPPPHKSRH